MKHQLIQIERTKTFKEKPTHDQLVFGVHFTDHMFIMDYTDDRGWHQPRIVPYQPITLDPAAKIFHYGQSIFEGLKAYRSKDDRILLFRPEKNVQRMNRSNARLSIPAVDENLTLQAIRNLVEIDQDWIPSQPGTSLYIRPFIIATEPSLGVSPSKQYQLMIIMSPVGAYYAEGVHPVKIWVETEYVRAVRGGVGEAKTAGNYAAGLKAQQGSSSRGYSQILWLDGVHRKYIEEVGSMNVFFKINGVVHTPALNGSILDGITRRSIIELLQDWKIPVQERAISMEEIYEAGVNGTLEEVFGTGTAAVISPIGQLHWNDKKLVIHKGQTGPLTAKLYDTLTAIQTGAISDPYGWTVEV